VYATEHAQYLVQQGDNNFATWMLFIYINNSRYQTKHRREEICFIYLSLVHRTMLSASCGEMVSEVLSRHFAGGEREKQSNVYLRCN
jgi:hypothetical protein